MRTVSKEAVKWLVAWLLACVATLATAQEIVLPGGARGGPIALR